MQFLQCRKSFSTKNISFLDVKFFLTLYIRVLLSFLFLRLPICLKFGDLDFGIVLGEVNNPASNELVIMLDRMSACLPAAHELVQEKSISFQQLQGEKFIMQHSNTHQYKEVYYHCRKAGFVPDIALCTSQLKTIKQLVANGMGISILPDFVTRGDKNFVLRPLRPSLKVQVSLNWGENKALSPVDKQFIEFIKDYANKYFA